MVDSELFDVVVIGGGPVGLAAAYEVAKSGLKVIILDQNNFFNHAGTSGGLARIFRTMYAEELMAKLAKTSMSFWDDLENDAGVSLRSMNGLLNFGEKGIVMSVAKNLNKLGMNYEKLTAQEIEQKYPFKNLDPQLVGIFAPDNGIINVQLLLRTLYCLARNRGAEAKSHTQVKKICRSEKKNSNWEVHAISYGSLITYSTKKIIIASGNSINHILRPSFNMSLDLETRQVITTYFKVNSSPDGTGFPSTWFYSTLMGNKQPHIFSGMPALPWGLPSVVRVVVEATQDVKNPSTIQGHVPSPRDIENIQTFIRDHITSVDHITPTSTITCMKASVFDGAFVLDFLPEKYLHGVADRTSIAIFTAGWAMKFVPLLGKALAQMVCNGESEFAYKEFSITRKNPMTGKDLIVNEDKGDVEENLMA